MQHSVLGIVPNSVNPGQITIHFAIHLQIYHSFALHSLIAHRYPFALSFLFTSSFSSVEEAHDRTLSLWRKRLQQGHGVDVGRCQHVLCRRGYSVGRLAPQRLGLERLCNEDEELRRLAHDNRVAPVSPVSLLLHV